MFGLVVTTIGFAIVSFREKKLVLFESDKLTKL